MRKLFFIVMLFALPNFAFAQGQGNIWHFGGGAGIDFNSGSAVAISGPITTDEGTACICDACGNLLFSTDGYRVYNSTGALMATGLFGGCCTSTQAALIVPFPNDANKFYIFTSDYEAHPHGICYSIVDMTMNGGLGDVIRFNTQLIAPACEKLTAIKNSNGHDYWVITHAYPSNEYYVYPVTDNGVGNPVITAIGEPIIGTDNTVGYLKFSPNGQKLVSVRLYASNNSIEIYNFNTSTGVLLNYQGINYPMYIYGISFSPDNTKLYISRGANVPNELEQFDITIPNFQNFPYVIIPNTSTGYGALQLAPDGKIYLAKPGLNYLCVINNPNLAGAACDYVEGGFPLLAGTYSQSGLPNFIERTLPNFCSVNLNSVNLNCNNNFSDTIYAGGCNVNYLWNTGETSESIEVSDSGNYSVTVTNIFGCSASDTIHVSTIPPLAYSLISQTDSLLCSGDNNGFININGSGGTIPYNYVWSNGATTEDLNNLTAGTYSVTVSDAGGCTASDTVDITAPNQVIASLTISADTVFCSVTGGTPSYHYLWSTGATTSFITNATNGTYTVTVSDINNCTALASVVISDVQSINDEGDFIIYPNPASSQLIIDN